VLPEIVGALTWLSGSSSSSRWQDLPEPEHDPDEVRRRADEILSRRRYQWDDESRNPIDRLAEWISEQLSKITGSFGGGGTLPTWVGWLVLALLVLLIAFIVFRLRANLRRNPRAPGTPEAVVVAEGDDGVDWAAEADRHEAAGRWRDALRCRYRVLVGELAEREVIPDLVGRTAGEYVRDVGRTCPPATPAFRAATDLFEAAWYGGADTGRAERDRFVQLADEVLAVATRDNITEGVDDRPLAVPT
jgi:uncharacterized protein DUF4129